MKKLIYCVLIILLCVVNIDNRNSLTDMTFSPDFSTQIYRNFEIDVELQSGTGDPPFTPGSNGQNSIQNYSYFPIPNMNSIDFTHEYTEMRIWDLCKTDFATFTSPEVSYPTTTLTYDFVIPDADDFIQRTETLAWFFFEVRSTFNSTPPYTSGLNISSFSVKPLNYRTDSLYNDSYHILPLHYSVLSFPNNRYLYNMSSADFTHYSEDWDLQCLYANNFTFSVKLEYTGYPIGISFYIYYTFEERLLPSAIDFSVNGLSLIDTANDGGYQYWFNHSNWLNFSSNYAAWIYFSFEIVSYFHFADQIEVLSPTFIQYYQLCTTSHQLIITDFQTDVEYKHGFLQNILLPAIEPLLIQASGSLSIQMYLEDVIHVELLSTSLTQLTTSVSTKDSTVLFRECLQPSRNFSKFYKEIEFDVTNYSVYFQSNVLNSTESNDIIYISQYATTSDEFEIYYAINPNFEIRYSILSQESFRIYLLIEYRAALSVENVTAYLQLPFYYDSWQRISDNSSLSQSQLTSELSIANLSFSNEWQNLTVLGNYPDPVTVYYENFRLINQNNSLLEITNHSFFSFAADVIIPTSYFFYYFPINESWSNISIWNGNNELSLSSEKKLLANLTTFNVLTIYFRCNPISFYSINQTLNRTILQIQSEFAFDDFRIEFSVPNSDFYLIRNGTVALVDSDSNYDYYISTFDIRSGFNQFEFIYDEPTPVIVSYSNFIPSYRLIEPVDYANEISITGTIQIPNAYFLYNVPINETWNNISIYKQNSLVQFNRETLLYMNLTTQDRLLINFQCVVITSYSISQTDNQIFLSIQSDIALTDMIVVFYVENSQNYKLLNGSATKSYEQVGFDFYVMQINLNAGQNLIVINYEKYAASSWWMYLLPFIGIVAAFVAYYYLKPKYQAWKIERERKKAQKAKNLAKIIPKPQQTGGKK